MPSDGDHEVEPWDNVSRVLDDFVEVGTVLSTRHMRLLDIRRQMSQCIKHSHVCRPLAYTYSHSK